MAICTFCAQEMGNGVGCTTVTVEYPDNLVLPSIINTDSICHDCKAPPHCYHHNGCDMERCPRCGGQLISCGCLDEEDE